MTSTHSTTEIELDVRGMTCDSCALHVANALQAVPGVEKADVPAWESGKATVLVVPEINLDELTASVAKAGYSASIRTTKSLSAAPEAESSNHTGSDFDLLIVGGGSAGFAAAIKASELGFRAGIVNDGAIGGTCVNIGCVPSKTLIRAMDAFHQAGQARFRGVQTMAGHLNWGQVVSHKDELVNELRQTKYVDVLASYPAITLIEGRAKVKPDYTLEVNGQPYTYRKLILATGASPWIPHIPGLAETPYLTSTTALALNELPRSLVVLGANAVGLELAQVYARAGAQVIVLELLPRIVPFEDEEISQALQEALHAEGIHLVTSFNTEKVAYKNNRFILTGQAGETQVTFSAEQLLVATGRRPNTAGMGLEEAGIALDKRGEVIVNEILQSNLPDVYAAGDVTGRDMFVYVAAYAGQLATENALTDAGRVYDAAYIPRVTFTDPQVASAGLTEFEARQQGYEIKVSVLPMKYVPRALAARDTRGVFKLVVNAANDQILGAHILAPEAGEMIQPVVLAIRFGITVQQLRETMFPYLTNAEALKLAVLGLEKDVSQLSCCAG
jgi:mercuric reductase